MQSFFKNKKKIFNILRKIISLYLDPLCICFPLFSLTPERSDSQPMVLFSKAQSLVGCQDPVSIFYEHCTDKFQLACSSTYRYT